MAIEIIEDKQIKGVNTQTPHKKISSYSHMNKQHDNEDDRLSMFADGSSTITTSIDQVFYARENIHTYEKAPCSELHEGKTNIIKQGKEITKNITQATLRVNFTIIKVGETKHT